MNRSKHYFSIRGDVPQSVEVFGMENKYAGYVFLVDSCCQIRWKAAGIATGEELEEYKCVIKNLTEKP